MSHHQKFSSASISPQPSPPPSATRSRNRLPLSSLHHLPESSTECFPTATTTTTSDSRRNRTQPQRRNNKKSSVVATATAATHSKKASAECTDSQLDKLRRALPPVPAQSVLRRRVSKWAASGTAKFVVGYKVIPLPLSAKEEEGFCYFVGVALGVFHSDYSLDNIVFLPVQIVADKDGTAPYQHPVLKRTLGPRASSTTSASASASSSTCATAEVEQDAAVRSGEAIPPRRPCSSSAASAASQRARFRCCRPSTSIGGAWSWLRTSRRC